MYLLSTPLYILVVGPVIRVLNNIVYYAYYAYYVDYVYKDDYILSTPWRYLFISLYTMLIEERSISHSLIILYTNYPVYNVDYGIHCMHG